MAGKKYQIELDLQDRDAKRKLKDLADSTGDVEDGIEDVESAGKAMARAISQSADDMESEIDSTKRAVDALEQAMDGAIDSFDSAQAVAELKQVGLTSEQIEADAEELADALKRVDDVNLKAVNSGLTDMKTNAVGIPEDVDHIRRRGEGLQSAIPAMRGFTDELGGSAAQAGIASQAIADLGDFSLIMGESFGISERATARLGTALGALGLGGVVIGGAIAGMEMLRRRQRKVEEQTQETTEALLDQLDILDEIEGRFDEAGNAYELFSDKLLSDEDDRQKVLAFLQEFGLTIEDLPGVLRALESQDLTFFEDLFGRHGFSPENARTLAEITTGLGGVGDSVSLVGDDAARAGRDLVRFSDTLGALQSEAAAENVLDVIATSSADARERIATLREEMGQGATSVALLDEYMRRYGSTLEDVAEETDDAADAQAHAEEIARGVADAYLEQADAANAVAEAQESLADKTYNVQEAQWALQDTLAEHGPILEKAKVGSRDYGEAQIAIAEAAQAVADAQVEAQRGYKEAAGEQLSAAEATDIANASLLQQASTLDGRQRQAILRHIGLVNGIPTEVVSEIEGHLERGEIDKAERLLQETSRSRTARVDAQAHTGAAERALNEVARSRVMNVFPVIGGARYGVGGIPRKRAQGTPFDAGGPAIVGEEGMEVVDLPHGAKVLNARQSRERMRKPDGARGGTTTIIQHFPAGAIPRDVADAQRRYQRVQGPL